LASLPVRLAGRGMSTWSVPAGLPEGGFIVPDPPFHQGGPFTEPALWITDEPVASPGALFASLLALHNQTGLWPLLLTEHTPSPSMRPWHKGEISPVPAQDIDALDADKVLSARWESAASDRPDLFDFGEDAFPGARRSGWPGLADPAVPGRDPDKAAAALVATPGALGDLTPQDDSIFLGLVPAVDGAAALAACGWRSNAGAVAELAVVIRSWQQRFGARLCAIGYDTIGLSVAWPPATLDHARHVTAEHAAFCSETAYSGESGAGAVLNEYAGEIVGAQAWGFWWD
jgi:hypothetical protein